MLHSAEPCLPNLIANKRLFLSQELLPVRAQGPVFGSPYLAQTIFKSKKEK